MSIALLKQREINQYLAEAENMLSDVREIEELCNQYSDRFKVFSGAFHRIGEKMIQDGSTLRDGLIGAGSILVGGVIDWFAESSAEKKRKEALAKLLPKKQEIARAKISYINAQIPKMQEYSALFQKHCKEEAGVCYRDREEGEMLQLEKNIIQIFELYQKFTFIYRVCLFFKSEFHAWLRGDIESKSEVVDYNMVYYDCVNDLMNWSRIPYKRKKWVRMFGQVYSYPNKNRIYPSMGMIALFRDETINLYANMNTDFNTYALSVSHIMNPPLTKSEKTFYNKYMRKSAFIKDASRNNIFYTIILTLLFTVFSIIGCFRYFESAVWEWIFSILSLVTIPILGIFFCLYQLTNVQSRRIGRIYQQIGFKIEEESVYEGIIQSLGYPYFNAFLSRLFLLFNRK